MKISMRKLSAIAGVKTKALFEKNVIIVPVMVIGLTFVMKLVYGAMMDGEGIPEGLLVFVLNLGVSMNIVMTGMFVTSAALAEEKEKHTLRTLMTSSVNSLEFFLGSVIPPFIEILLINVVLLPISGISMQHVNIAMYLGVSALAGLTSCIIGMLIGIFAKNQMSASTLTTPFMLVFMMLPTFASLIPSLERISKFLFTGVISQMVISYAGGMEFTLSLLNIVVLVGEILIAMGLFLFFYRKNGYESE